MPLLPCVEPWFFDGQHISLVICESCCTSPAGGNQGIFVLVEVDTSVTSFHIMSWTQRDTIAFQEMISKAKECGMWDQLAMSVHGGSPSSDFTLISSSSEAMTDASQRRVT